MIKDRISIFALLYALMLALFFVYLNHLFYHDDSYITLRYAHNWIEGNGIVWNPGEYVQGYSNFLHLVLVSLLGRFGIGLPWASRLVGFSSLLGLVGLMLWAKELFTDKNHPTTWHIPALLIMASVPILVWALGGLETVLFAFLVAASCASLLLALKSERSERSEKSESKSYLYFASGILGGLCFLARPDGVIIVAISGLWLCWLMLIKREMRLQFILLYAFGAMLIAFPYMLWQFSYYGDVVPNTFYAKTGAPFEPRIVNGLKYVISYFLTPPFLPPLLGASLMWAGLRRSWSPQLTYLAILISTYLAYVVWVGGDHMTSYRFIVPVIPMMSIMLALALQVSVEPQYYKSVINFMTVLILVLLSLQIPNKRINPQMEDLASNVGTVVGKYIADAWSTGSVVALNTAGSTPFYATSHRYVDMLGLNDATIAKRHIDAVQLPIQNAPGHLKGDGQYVFARRPDYIIIGPAEGAPISDPWFLSDLELSLEPTFEDNYELVTVLLDSESSQESPNGDFLFTFYQRIDAESD